MNLKFDSLTEFYERTYKKNTKGVEVTFTGSSRHLGQLQIRSDSS